MKDRKGLYIFFHKGKNMSSYKSHPRMLELRLVLLYDIAIREYGVDRAERLFKSIADGFMCDWTRISAVLSAYEKIKLMQKRDIVRYRQEIIFLGALYNINRNTLARIYMGYIQTRSLFTPAYLYSIDNFLDSEWLAKLDDEAVYCHLKPYRREVEQFVFSFYGLVDRFSK